MTESTTAIAVGHAKASRSSWAARTWRDQPLGVVAAGYILLVAVLGALAPVIAPYPAGKQDLLATLSGPTAEHLLGTDTLGRDILSRLLHGTIPSLGYALIALAVFLLVGVPFGIVAGYVGGRIDGIISRVGEIALSIPVVIILLVVLAVFSSNPVAAMVTLGVLAAPGLVRVARGATLVVREEAFVTAATVSGVRPSRIMGTHVLRRVLGPLLVQASLFLGSALVVQAALAFLGLLSSGDDPTWGGMIGEASQVVSFTSWPLLPPGLAIILMVLAFGIVGDAVRDSTADESTPRVRRRTRAVSDGTATSASTSSLDDTSGDHLLEVHDLRVVLDGGVALVDGASFTVDRGEVVAVVGESGCGKSVTALAVLGLLPHGLEVESGSVVFDGVDLTRGGPSAYSALRGSGIGYVAQDALGSLDPTHSIGSHLREVITRHEKLASAATRARAQELLAQVRIPDPDRVLALYPHEISGGMAQRVNIALALAGRPRLIVADEPTTALDVTVQAEILRLLRDLQRESGMSVLIITHNWGVVADIADRAVVMYAGEVVERGTVHDVFDTPRFPYTAALLAADPSTAAPGERLTTIAGRVPAPGDRPVGCRFAGRCAFATRECTSAPIPLRRVDPGSVTRCIRVEQLVEQGALTR